MLKKLFAYIGNLGRVDNEAVYASLKGFEGQGDISTLGARIDSAKAADAANRKSQGIKAYEYKH